MSTFIRDCSSKPSTPYFKRDYCRAIMNQKVPKISELLGHKKASRMICMTTRELLFVKNTGKIGLFDPKT